MFPTTRRRSLTLDIVGGALILCWLSWWAVGLSQMKINLPGHLDFITGGDLGGDLNSSEMAVRKLLEGGNPYREPLGGRWQGWHFHYPPVVLLFFLWSGAFTTGQVVTIWFVISTVLLVLSVRVAWQWRPALNLETMPFLLCVGLTLFSLPVLFELQRGQYNVLVLFLVCCGGYLATRYTTLFAEGAAGICLAVAIWAKLYPIFLLLGLAAGRRLRLLTITCVAVVAIGATDWPMTVDSFHVQASPERESYYHAFESVKLFLSGRWSELQPDNTTWKHAHHPYFHSLADYLPGLWVDLGMTQIARIPGLIQAGAIAAPATLWLLLLQYRRRNPDTLLPLLLFLVVLATFVHPGAVDYGLCFVPVLLTMVWTSRDPWLIQAGACLFLLYCIPYRPDIHALGHITFQLKFWGFAAVGAMLGRRIALSGDRIGLAASSAVSEPFRF
jgi:hypothetical protein